MYGAKVAIFFKQKTLFIIKMATFAASYEAKDIIQL